MEKQVVTLENREKLTITKVIDIDAFDEGALWANIQEGSIEVIGQNLNIEKLDLEDGILIISGKIDSFSYIEKKYKERNKFLKIFKRD